MAPLALTQRLQSLTACKIQKGKMTSFPPGLKNFFLIASFNHKGRPLRSRVGWRLTKEAVASVTESTLGPVGHMRST